MRRASVKRFVERIVPRFVPQGPFRSVIPKPGAVQPDQGSRPEPTPPARRPRDPSIRVKTVLFRMTPPELEMLSLSALPVWKL